MKKIFPSFVLSIIVFLALSAVATSQPNGCKVQGSWIGFGDTGARWIATYHGQSASSGTSDLEFPLFDPTLGGMAPDAVNISSSRGVWVRTGGNTFAYTLIVFGLDATGNAIWIGKNSGSKTLNEDCNLMTIESTFEVFLPEVNPFEGDPIFCGPSSTSQAYRMRVDPSCSLE